MKGSLTQIEDEGHILIINDLIFEPRRRKEHKGDKEHPKVK